jgi:hypothetical protein
MPVCQFPVKRCDERRRKSTWLEPSANPVASDIQGFSRPLALVDRCASAVRHAGAQIGDSARLSQDRGVLQEILTAALDLLLTQLGQPRPDGFRSLRDTTNLPLVLPGSQRRVPVGQERA